MATNRRTRATSSSRSRTAANSAAKAKADTSTTSSADQSTPNPEAASASEVTADEPVETVAASDAQDYPLASEVVPAVESAVTSETAVVEESSTEPSSVAESTQAPAETPAVTEAPQGEKAMSQEETVQITPQPVKEETALVSNPQHKWAVLESPVMPSDIEVVGTIQSAGIRPIGASHLAVFGTILNGRPILASNLKVSALLPGNSPIFYDDVQYLSGDAGLPGHRPILVSPPALLAAPTLMGDRPIFSNENVDPEPAVLMGYLD